MNDTNIPLDKESVVTEAPKAPETAVETISETIMPDCLKKPNFNFILIDEVKGDGKKPKGNAWQKKVYRFDNSELIEHLKKGYNYGCQPNNSVIDINGESKFLIMIDFDTKEFQDKILDKFPETFTTTSGSYKECVHLWLACDNNKAFKIKDKELNTLADIIGAGNQVIAPGSKHCKGSTYSVVKDVPIAFMPYSELEALMKPYDESPKKAVKPVKQWVPQNISNNVGEDVVNQVSMETVLTEIGIDTQLNPTNCFGHSSKGGKCFSWNNETAHCFHCDGSWNKFSLIKDAKNISSGATFDWFADKAGMVEELKQSRLDYMKENEDSNKSIADNFTRRGQIESFWEKEPFFYDHSKLFWKWDKKEYKWVLSDEVDFCNLIYDTLGIETINSKAKSELAEGFRQVGRKHQPEGIKKSWVQYKDKIYDIKTGEVFDATPKHFVTNPIPWAVGESEDTPILDKTFEQWVGKKYVKTLYQIIAYNTCLDKFMQRLFAFCGGGANGKGTYIKINQKFIGKGNYISSEIKALSEDKFEAANLYRKLLCIMGEVSHNDLRNTNMLKKLGGEDEISFQFKNKGAFTDENTATCACLTNSMPITPDKSVGFYRKWMIIDFPNEFPNVKGNFLDRIPEVEFNNLAKKSLRILKELYDTEEFENEGTFEDRERRYEERSNPVMKFVDDFCEEDAGKMVSLRDFTNEFNKHVKKSRMRPMTAKQIGGMLRTDGFLVGKRKIGNDSVVAILNLELKLTKTTETTETTEDYTSNPHVESSGTLGSLGSLGSNNTNLDSFSQNEYKLAGYDSKEEYEQMMEKNNE